MTGTYCVIGSYFSRNYGYAATRFFEIDSPRPIACSSDRARVLKTIRVNRDHYATIPYGSLGKFGPRGWGEKKTNFHKDVTPVCMFARRAER
jgi:hypothetical protein